MSFNIPLKDRSFQEKLAVMESPWEGIARTRETIEPSAWHNDILEERRHRLADGQSQFVD